MLGTRGSSHGLTDLLVPAGGPGTRVSAVAGSTVQLAASGERSTDPDTDTDTDKHTRATVPANLSQSGIVHLCSCRLTQPEAQPPSSAEPRAAPDLQLCTQSRCGSILSPESTTPTVTSSALTVTVGLGLADKYLSRSLLIMMPPLAAVFNVRPHSDPQAHHPPHPHQPGALASHPS
eukprot:1682751-Rhodomonas_salina.1